MVVAMVRRDENEAESGFGAWHKWVRVLKWCGDPIHRFFLLTAVVPFMYFIIGHFSFPTLLLHRRYTV